jgi:hypothetical protein
MVAAFESCTMRTERGVGLRPPEKGTGMRWLALLGAQRDLHHRRSQTSLLC